VSRWVVGLAVLVVLATAAPAQADEPPTLGLVGDSIPLQAVIEIRDQVTLDRRIAFSYAGLGFTAGDVLDETREALEGPDPPDIFVAFLGTAQSNVDRPARWGRQLRRLLDLVSGRVDCIRVFDIDQTVTGFRPHHDRYAPTYNRITHAMVSQYPDAEWFHYSLWAALAGPEYERRDHLHHNAAGRREMGRLVRQVAASCDPALTSGPFWDVPDDHWAAEEIAWAAQLGLVDGYPNDSYRAEVGTFVLTITRGQFLSMLWRLQGRPDGFGPHPWSDGTARLDDALRWAAATGVGVGFADGRYRPGAPSSRGQALAMLWRLAGRPDGFGPHPWSDGVARLDGALRWAAATGVMGGYRDGTFRPDLPLSRAQAAQVLFRSDGL
jgi:hypothetical protein